MSFEKIKVFHGIYGSVHIKEFRHNYVANNLVAEATMEPARPQIRKPLVDYGWIIIG